MHDTELPVVTVWLLDWVITVGHPPGVGVGVAVAVTVGVAVAVAVGVGVPGVGVGVGVPGVGVGVGVPGVGVGVAEQPWKISSEFTGVPGAAPVYPPARKIRLLPSPSAERLRRGVTNDGPSLHTPVPGL